MKLFYMQILNQNIFQLLITYFKYIRKSFNNLNHLYFDNILKTNIFL